MTKVFTIPAVIILVVFSGCSTESNETVSTIEVTENMPDDEAWSFSVTMTTNGIKTAEVRSGYMAHYENRREYELSDSVTADFYDRGNHTSQLTSETATINDERNDLVARGNVVVVSDSGFTLFTEELKWDNERALIFTDEFVTLITDVDTLYGTGFESDRSLKNYKIFNPTGNLLIKK
ncbi:LPS export ABC transporter periplasmic protein LptC [candidate division KSB1 bacterium]|nr:LPS export ABC transporter periplasmic protein LptC [candidate division KSB1 bacterium]MCH8285885.1 LPS export ABC transporter periplasmic protein LptC [candidate division KSB1 bacterium]